MGTYMNQAGNTVVPAFLTLESLGFHVEVSPLGVRATLGDAEYAADDPVAVLGLVKLVEVRARTDGPRSQD